MTRTGGPKLTVIPGGGTGGNLDQMKLLGRTILPQLVDQKSRIVRFGSVAEVESFLRQFQVLRASEITYPQDSPVGKMIFFTRERFLVRVKTHGEAKGPRGGKAHMSVSLMNGTGLAWQDEQAKFDYRGHLVAKVKTPINMFLGRYKDEADGSRSYVDFQGKPHQFVEIIGEDPEDIIGKKWADDTHFFFPTATIS